jgi:acylphosphatase
MFYPRFVSSSVLTTLLLSMTSQIVNADDTMPTMNSECAYGFTVCPGAGGSDEGVDFRSHFAVYAATHNLSGWTRNGCDKCVHGMFASFDNCDDANDFVDVLQDESRLLVELDKVATNLVATIVNITGYPNKPEEMCPDNNNGTLPEGYIAQTHAVVDWSFSSDGCSTPCGCLPTSTPVKDCADSGPLPENATYTLECQRHPLGSNTKNFADCNSIYTFEGVSCWKIDDGVIVSSGLCTNGDGTEYGWVNDTQAAFCCGPYDTSYKFGRKGIYPNPSDSCGVYGENNLFSKKCDPPSDDTNVIGDTLAEDEEYLFEQYNNTDNETSSCAYGFTVCSSSSSGGDEGVDFRSHFAIYGSTHNLSGWVRNSCNKCVYGMFASLDGNCTNAHEFVDALNDPDVLLDVLDNRASGLAVTIENITGYPNEPGMCENGLELPEGFVQEKYPVVDWVFSTDGCTTPCDCLPQTPYKDCAETGTGKNNCREYPLGTDMKHFPDCNSIYHHNGVSCWYIESGNIISSGMCGPGGPEDFEWVNETHAAECCGPYDVTNEYGRPGIFPPYQPNCSAYGSDNPLEASPYEAHCIIAGDSGYLDEGRQNSTIEKEEEEGKEENTDANLDEIEQQVSEEEEKKDDETSGGGTAHQASYLLFRLMTIASMAIVTVGFLL